MQRLKNILIIGGTLAVLATIGTMMNRGSDPGWLRAAAAGPEVTIGAPVPLPTMAAQSGAWNVGITGTPAVQLSGTPTVNVTNPAAAPLFFVNLNDPGRIPYQSLITINNCGPMNQCLANFPAVPSQHRLVVQHFSGTVGHNIAPPWVIAFLRAPNGDFLSRFSASIAGQNAEFDQPVLVYYDAGEQPFVTTASGAVASFASFTLSGYLLDCKVAPCAAIAQ